jgi:hypothetical protein
MPRRGPDAGAPPKIAWFNDWERHGHFKNITSPLAPEGEDTVFREVIPQTLE